MNSYTPSKKEMMGWDPQDLADYMTELQLSGCDKAVMKRGISGAEFMQMTERDLQVFPSIYFPILSKIQSQVSMSDKKQSYQQRSNVQKFPQQAFAQGDEEVVWDSDEFDKSDEEELQQGGGGNDFIRTMSEPEDVEENSSEGYQIPPNEENMNLPPPPSDATLEDSNYREDPAHDLFPDTWPLKPLPPPHQNYPPQRPQKSPAGQPSLPIDRNKKPGKSGSSKKDQQKSKGGNAKESRLFSRKGSKSRPAKPTDATTRSKHCPLPSVTKLSADINSPAYSSEPRECIADLDPSWYGGQVSRHLAEAAVREVNEDGAFIVRDSSAGSDKHPYTLVLLAHDKVYNIKICNQGNTYFLGNGLNKKSFPGVKEIITHHTHTPLLLIDAKDPNSEAYSRCCLLHPAGL